MSYQLQEQATPIQSASRILIVDDDAGHACSVQALLDAHGLAADVETAGQAGLQRLISDEAAVDVLILDLNIPDLPGLAILEALSRQAEPPKTIVVSGESGVDQVAPVLRHGAYDYLKKPFVPEELMLAVNNALTARALERESERHADQAEASNRLNAFLVDASPDLIYVLDEKGKFSFVNGRLQEIFHCDPEEAVGLPWQELLGPELGRRLQFRFNERRTQDRATRGYEFDYISPRGTEHILEFSATGLYEEAASRQFAGTYGVVRDVTDTRQTARDLLQSQRKFYALFMESPDAVFISRLDDGSLLEGNDGFQAIKRAFSALDSRYDTFIWDSPVDRAAFVEELIAAKVHLKQSFQRELDGATRYYELNARILELDDEPCILGAVRDRTQEQLAEMERLHMQTQLQQASKMEAIGQLAGGIAHDFNNILASIIGYADLVLSSRERLKSEQVDGYLSEVVTAGHRARDLISQMLTFTRASRGDPEPVDIASAIADVSRMLRAAIPSSIDIHADFKKNVKTVLADPVQLQQVILNLLINARDAISGNGRIEVSLRMSDEPMSCAVCGERLQGEFIELSVADTGHGIDPKILPRIFDMYFTTRDPSKGTGIGLWLINNLIHEYEGHVSVISRPEEGTRFIVQLPPADRQVPETSPAVEERPTLAGAIVVVDDEVSVSSFIAEVLRDHGYDVVVFNDSPTALKFLEDPEQAVSLLLTDQAMPTMTGLELSAASKRVRPELPIVLITGFVARKNNARMAEIGIEGFLAKPFRIDELLAEIRRHSIQQPA